MKLTIFQHLVLFFINKPVAMLSSRHSVFLQAAGTVVLLPHPLNRCSRKIKYFCCMHSDRASVTVIFILLYAMLSPRKQYIYGVVNVLQQYSEASNSIDPSYAGQPNKQQSKQAVRTTWKRGQALICYSLVAGCGNCWLCHFVVVIKRCLCFYQLVISFLIKLQCFLKPPIAVSSSY